MKRLIFWLGFWCAVSGTIISMSASLIYMLSMLFGMTVPDLMVEMVQGGIVAGAFGLLVVILGGGWLHGK